MSALKEHGLVVNATKCSFGRQQIEFLGHVVTSHGIWPVRERVQAVRDFQRPQTVKGLQRFLGMVNFYRRFVKNAAWIMLPLTNALKGQPKTLKWTDNMTRSFQLTKQALADASLLVHPDSTCPLQLVTDASCRARGGVVQQIVDGKPHPLAFFSRRTTDTESTYSPYDIELLSLYTAILHFRHMLEGRKFSILTDQKPLTSAFLKGKDPIFSRQRNQLAFINEFCTDIGHVPGLDNVVADSLSRQFEDDRVSTGSIIVQTIAHVLSDVDLCKVASDQGSYEEWQTLQTAITGLKLQLCSFPGMQEQLLCDISLDKPRIYLPVGWRKKVFNALHALAHPSGKATLSAITRDYVWHKMRKDVMSWAKECIECQRNKIGRYTQPPVQTIPVPPTRFAHVHVDLVGPFAKTKGFESVFSIPPVHFGSNKW